MAIDGMIKLPKSALCIVLADVSREFNSKLSTTSESFAVCRFIVVVTAIDSRSKLM